MRRRAADWIGWTTWAIASVASAQTVSVGFPDGSEVLFGTVAVGGTTDLASGRVSISIDGGPFRLAEGLDPWTFDWDTASVTNGPHTLTARARTCPGCPETLSTVDVQVDNGRALGVLIERPFDDAEVSDTLVVSGVSTGAVDVSLAVDDGSFEPTNGLGAWTRVLEPGALSEGAHLLTVRAEGADGATATDTVSIVVVGEAFGESFSYSSSVDGELLQGALHVPEGLDLAGPPVGLVVHLHGGGGTGRISDDLAAQLDARGWIGLAPDGRRWGLAEQGCTWSTSAAYVDNPDPDVGPGEQDVLDAIDWARATFPIDDDRTYLIGFSMGGRGAYTIGLRNPDRFAAIGPMGPAVDMYEIFARRPEPCICKEGMVGGKPGDSPLVDTLYTITSGRFLLENAYNLPVFHGHGTLDTVASNTPTSAPFLHGWHVTTDTSWSDCHATPATVEAWGNDCFDGDPASLPLEFCAEPTPTLSELSAAFPEGYPWAYLFTPVGHVTDPLWFEGAEAGPDLFGVEDPDDPGRLLGMFEFFDTHLRVDSPETVVFKTYTDTHRAAYWLNVLITTPWSDVPGAARSRRDVEANRLDLELVRVERATVDLEQTGLSLALDRPLTLAVERLVEPTFDPALVADGELLRPTIVLTGPFEALGAVTVLRDGAALPPAQVRLGDGELEIGPFVVGPPTELVVTVERARSDGLVAPR